MLTILFTRQLLPLTYFLHVFLSFSLFLNCSSRDILTESTSIHDSRGETLVSSGKRFELGFFTPSGSSGRRYVGIWYYKSNPLTIVWVANRDNPLLDSNGVFSIAEDGNLNILDGSGRSCWSTNLERSSSSADRKTKLMDSGNLVVTDSEQENQLFSIVWQSFDNPTDTFLPGMKMSADMTLVSWKSYDDPASGNFSFKIDQEGNQFVIWKRSVRYWKSGISDDAGTSSAMPSVIYYFLQLDTEKIWSLIWAQPRTRCSLYNACGNFGSCNSNNELVCKCLPGFQPISPEYWHSGDYSGGCIRRSPLCSNNGLHDKFLNLKMMKVGKPDSQFKATSETECKMECLNNCQCEAFSYEAAAIPQWGGSGSSTCWIWLETLADLQEEYDGGRSLNVRISDSDRESIRSCGTCGANMIPYPLSTGSKCGDPAYSNFYCNTSTGQLNFETPSGAYRITRVNPELHKFVIQTKDADSCKALNSSNRLLLVNQSSPFHVTRSCSVDMGGFSPGESPANGDEVEIAWLPPTEPTCISSADCACCWTGTCGITSS